MFEFSYWDILLSPLFIFLFVVTFYTFALILKEPKKSATYEVSPNVRRSILTKDKDQLLKTPQSAPHVNTLYLLLKHSAEQYTDRNCLGDRNLIHIEEREEEVSQEIAPGKEKLEKKKRNYYEMGPYTWMTHGEFYDWCKAIGRGLVHKDGGGIDRKVSKLGIFAATSKEWFGLSHGCFTQNITLVTVFPNLGEEGLMHAVNQCELEHLCVDFERLHSVKDILKKCPTLSTVIYKDDPLASHDILDELNETGIKVISIDKIAEVGKQQEEVIDLSPPSPDDLALIMYTSGTTGTPKGVMITHGNVIAVIAGALPVVGEMLQPEDSYICVLPLAHIIELVVENAILFIGGSLGYSSPRTMTNQYMMNCKGDLEELRPTLMAGVPALWETIRKTVRSRLQKTHPALRFAFKAAYMIKRYWIEHGYRTPLLDLLMFRETRNMLGGRIKLLVSGGAPLSPETHAFLRICVCYPVSHCYGLTETCGPSTLTDLDDLSMGNVGFPSLCCEIKLEEVSEMGYSPKNNPPSGEICFRGFNVTQGYFKDEENTKESYRGGWFHTGDIGMWKDGLLVIVDRKKNLVKLSNGEYIALEYLESKYKCSPLIDNVCVYADSHQSYPVALVIPNKEAMKDIGIGEEMINSSKSTKAILDDIQQIAKQEGLKSYEIVRDVVLTSELWTTDNNMLTPVMKLKRQNIMKKYKDQLDALYR